MDGIRRKCRKTARDLAKPVARRLFCSMRFGRASFQAMARALQDVLAKRRVDLKIAWPKAGYQINLAVVEAMESRQGFLALGSVDWGAATRNDSHTSFEAGKWDCDLHGLDGRLPILPGRMIPFEDEYLYTRARAVFSRHVLQDTPWLERPAQDSTQAGRAPG